MKVYLQVIDTRTGIYQTGMIDEPISDGMFIDNALRHFGVDYPTINWLVNQKQFRCGNIEGTTKIVSIVTV